MQEADLIAGTNNDLVASIEKHQRVVSDVVEGGGSDFSTLSARTARGEEESRNVPEALLYIVSRYTATDWMVECVLEQEQPRDSVMIPFDTAHAAVHYPKDRRFRIWVRPSILIGIGAVVLAAVIAAWIEVAVAGLPTVPPVPQIYPNNFVGPHGFPVWG